MRRCGAYLGVVAVLVALLTAPLFHMHVREEHGHAVSFVHAHVAELERPDDHIVSHFEGAHSHANARWVDVFTFDAFSWSFDRPVELAARSSFVPLPQAENVVLPAEPQAHSPPVLSLVPPRPPPFA